MSFILLAVLFFQNAHADETLIPKKQFTSEFKAGLPNSFCSEKSYFQKCFDLPADKCKIAVAAAVDGCIAALDGEMPAQFHQPADGQTWGKKIGACAGQKYETDLVKSKKDSADCNDPSKWQP